MRWQNLSTLVILSLTLFGIAVGRFPVLRMNRATIVIVGTALLVFSGALSPDQAWNAIDYRTILLIFSMMILNINLGLAGFFKAVTLKVTHLARTPGQLLGLVIVTSGLLSAFFLNDTVVLMMTPLVIEICRHMNRDPVPYLIGLAASANIGSAATMIGNPQNMLIGVTSGIPFFTFFTRLAPVSVAGMMIIWIILKFLYPCELKKERLQSAVDLKFRIYRPLLHKCLIAIGLLLAALFAGLSIVLAAFGAASFLLVTRRLKPRRVFHEIDWSLLVFFSGLFIITRCMENTGVGMKLVKSIGDIAHSSVLCLTVVSTLLSNVISNVPAVILMRPGIASLANPDRAWIVLAMATTLAGNLTLLGSVANLIVAESAEKRGVRLTFNAYLKAGIPITLLSLAAGVLWILIIRI